MLSLAPPCVYLPLPAGLLREQEIEGEKKGVGKLGGRRGKLRGEIDTVEGANKAGAQELNRSAV